MARHQGLRLRMAASYVLVTAAAVAVVELVTLVLLVPRLVADSKQRDRSLLVGITAHDYAAQVLAAAGRLGRLPTGSEIQLGESGLVLAPREVRMEAGGEGVRIPYTAARQDERKPLSLAVLLNLDGRIAASSYPPGYPAGAAFGGPGVVTLPAGALAVSPKMAKGENGQADTTLGPVLCALAPVNLLAADGKPNAGIDGAGQAIGYVYVQVPYDDRLPLGADLTSPGTDVGPLLIIGLLVTLAALPVGVVFGLLSTKTLIGRLRRLAASTVAVADGDYHHRVPVSGTDEVGQLEANFNRMAVRLAEAMSVQRQLAGAGERARIARELHDSISQDLYSLRLLAGGLRRALPAGSPLLGRVEAMESTATGTVIEMRALLLELRPVALRDADLAAALAGLCAAYGDRLGVPIATELAPVTVAPAVEHAALRIAQEALANAVRHAHPTRIAVRLDAVDGGLLLSVTDDGAGFDPERAGDRHGMGLPMMRERVTELGGDLQVDSAPGDGTTVLVRLPGERP
ncbi:histidine kinase [Planotetraspora sp. A-T 1434]|uniref:HAMP domain-containing sensor histidine kinase n=1 Tax=Planotetraspora sp. A-T 1434 TaxID=2979219 RepID=UPI0021C0D224|nr:ATP-binding protein [Planotetraspora sp. A-T 1434]MCT9934610.1 histidine kinase [Planotetraspora sp. A-T 1434]